MLGVLFKVFLKIRSRLGVSPKFMPQDRKEMFMTKAGKRLDSCVWGRLRNSIVSLLVMLALVLSIPHSASAQG